MVEVSELKEWMNAGKREWLLKAIERNERLLETTTKSGARKMLIESIEDYKMQLSKIKK